MTSAAKNFAATLQNFITLISLREEGTGSADEMCAIGYDFRNFQLGGHVSRPVIEPQFTEGDSFGAVLREAMRLGLGKERTRRATERRWRDSDLAAAISQYKGSGGEVLKSLNNWKNDRVKIGDASFEALVAVMIEGEANAVAWRAVFERARQVTVQSKRPDSAGSQCVRSAAPRLFEAAATVLDIVGEVAPDLQREVQEAHEEIIAKGYLPSMGALADPLCRDVTDPGVREQIRLSSSVSFDPRLICREQPEVIKALIEAARTGAVLRPPPPQSSHEVSDDFIALVVDRHDHANELRTWADAARLGGRNAEALLLECVLSHGRSPADVRSRIADLQTFMATNVSSPVASAFINYRLSIAYRHVGLYAESDFVAERVRSVSTANARLQAMVLNLRHLNAPQKLYGGQDFKGQCARDGERLRDGVRAALAIDPDNLSIGNIRQVADISVVASALLGMIQTRRVIVAGNEEDALLALGQVERYGRCLQKIACDHALEGKHEYLFKHAYWELSRIAPFAVHNGWSRVLTRLEELFLDGFTPDDVHTCAKHRQFLTDQQGDRTEVNFAQMTIALAVKNEIGSGTGFEFMRKLLPNGIPLGLANNVLIGRAWSALNTKLGVTLDRELPSQTLAHMDSTVLLDCVARITDRPRRGGRV